MREEVVIVDAIRTPIGNMGGTLKDISGEDLACLVLKALLERTKLDPAAVDEVIVGQTKISADAPNIARTAALMAGVPIEVPAYTVSRQCGSGLQAVNSGAQAIMSGQAEVVLAAGTESMSNAVFYLRQARYGYRSGNGVLVDSNTESQFRSQPQDMFGVFNMGMTAENLAEKYRIAREEQDLFAFRSQEKANKAIQTGRFKEEIVPVPVKQKKGEPLLFDTDEFPKQTTLEKMAKLPPAFKEGGTVTAGNSSGRNDGASALLLMSAKRAQREGLKPLAVLRSQAAVGVDPRIMGIGPVNASRKALELAGLKLNQIDLIELNEAFAAQSLACIKELDLDQSIVNVNGGAIALGHPLGCTGARIMTTLLYEMKRRKARYGLATLCVAGGLGLADVVELV
ncbi:MAG: thiolase family protein [Peptococcaceae bacterium]|jgi:acetyl-CoA C-acetyltransferase|nr:thiolase family protein [Peptococcaceae bacterium]MDH7524968.1 thiolase family protein [Peptococcaceae bacterium]